ncbi:MAG: NAD(P)H-dependent glycerol-3-phosphate dehydrogenase [Candidatus Omnitrophota bacterium]
MSKISIIGDGGWGTALAILLNSKGLQVTLWSAFPEYAARIREKRENTKFLKGVFLPEGIRIVSDADSASGADITFFVVPSEYLRIVAEKFRGMEVGEIISATKGIENGSLKRASEILSEIFPGKEICALSGPSISGEVAAGMPTAVVLASSGTKCEDVRPVLMTESFRVYTSDDVLGVELGGAVKNVIAIAAGISDGMGFGTNTKAGLLTRGLAEITRLGVKMKAKSETFRGLSGLGDLATTCISRQSRNRWFGEEIGRGRKVNEIREKTEMAIEGEKTSRSVFQLSEKYGVDMPISKKVYEIIYKNADPSFAVRELMTRGAKREDYC